jgi:hypothetical protein
MTAYIHLLQDPHVDDEGGQIICNHCNLTTDAYLEPWENFLNGSWVSNRPTTPGIYPVILKDSLVVSNIEIPSKITEKFRKIMEGVELIWSMPVPFHSMKGL